MLRLNVPRVSRIFSELLLAVASCTCPASEFDHEHRAFATTLQRFVTNGLVDYASLKAQPKSLLTYLNQLGAVSRNEFSQWSTNQQLAYLINLYNAATLKLVIDHYPVKSIKKIGGLFGGPWNQNIVPLFGSTNTLDYLEYEVLLKNHREPRIHLALVCAALGCPELRGEPYTGARLNAQLEDQGRRFLNDPRKNRFDARSRILYLSPIFKWFAKDFEEKSGSVIKFVQPYFPATVQSELAREKVRIRYTSYDWALNDRVRR